MAEHASNGDGPILALLQQMNDRIDQRFDDLDRRFGSVDSRLDRVNDTLASVQTQMGALTSQMGAMTRWSDRFDREHTSVIQTQAAQQKAIDDLNSRISRLERDNTSS
ncbi:MAG TPA: hypothetical protein VEU96_26435 [Bryobacteraceae bacterium]|nr:hypothetical protein [Bryobacteraceae bacterium]